MEEKQFEQLWREASHNIENEFIKINISEAQRIWMIKKMLNIPTHAKLKEEAGIAAHIIGQLQVDGVSNKIARWLMEEIG